MELVERKRENKKKYWKIKYNQVESFLRKHSPQLSRHMNMYALLTFLHEVCIQFVFLSLAPPHPPAAQPRVGGEEEEEEEEEQPCTDHRRLNRRHVLFSLLKINLISFVTFGHVILAGNKEPQRNVQYCLSRELPSASK
jgi:hypothetical protein